MNIHAFFIQLLFSLGCFGLLCPVGYPIRSHFEGVRCEGLCLDFVFCYTKISLHSLYVSSVFLISYVPLWIYYVSLFLCVHILVLCFLLNMFY
jgi:hypothetical protein